MSNTRAPSPASSTRIDIPGLSIAALRHRSGDGRHRVLAVHGWLDNAASFVPMMPHLENIDLVAIDLPGHGHSGHLGRAAHYHFVDMLNWILDTAQALGWDTFHYLGHSLGGCIAPFVAVANPTAIRSIMLIEANGPLTEDAEKLPARLKRSHEDYQTFQNYKSRAFASIEEATDVRRHVTTMSETAARLIVERQLQETEDGHTWRYDRRHRSTSPVYLTEDQVLAVLADVSCPVLGIDAEEGYLGGRPATAIRQAQIQDLTLHEVPGHHHMHMDDPEPSARHINRFLQQLMHRSG